MIAQPGFSAQSPESPPTIEEEVGSLREKLRDACNRISLLEQRLPPEELVRTLIPIESPAVKFAMQRGAEVFGGAVEIEVASAPDDPAAKWYAITVAASGSAKEIVDKQLLWASELDRQFPAEAPDIRLSVRPQ
jgi:hypothetical protein